MWTTANLRSNPDFRRNGLLLGLLVIVFEVTKGQAAMCGGSASLQMKSSTNQCSFKEELLKHAILFTDVSDLVGVVNETLEPESSECRFRDGIDYICDSFDIVEVPPVSQFPKNFTRFFLNGTQVSTLKNRSFENLTIECIIIYDNSKLTTLEPDAFVGIVGLKVLIMQNNIHFEITNVPALNEDFFRPFVTLSELTHLSLQGNRIYLEGVNSSVSNPSMNGGPCLQYLDLSKNNLQKIEANFFRAFNCGSIKSLVLHSSDLQSIHEDSFRWISGLRKLDLSSNPKLFETANVTRSLEHLKTLLTLRLDSNYFNKIPVAILESVNGSLESLNLTLNTFEELKAGAFPVMPHLTTLYLDVCRINKISKDAFDNLPSLEYLSLTRNFIHEIPALTNSAQIRQLLFQGFDDDDNPFVIKDNVFTGFGSLEILSLNTLNLGNLTHSKLNGLNNLTTLRLEKSKLRGLEPEVFRATPRLKYLMMAYCTGLDKVTIDNLRGPDCLEVLDLSYIKIFPDNTTRKGSKQLSNPLANAKILNLTGSLTNNENPLDMLSLSSMPKLEVLEIGQNAITHWNSTKFGANPQLRRLVLNKNHEYLDLTLAMIEDFKKLEELDLSGNKFDCSPTIVQFFAMAEVGNEDKKQPQVIDWRHGEGYICKDKEDERHTFKDFAESGEDVENGVPLHEVGKLFQSDQSIIVIVCAVAGSVVAVTFLIFFTYYARSNWWYFEYLMARRKTQQNRKSLDTYVYDAFVSYSSDDDSWVHSYLVTNLEKNETEDIDEALQLCLHERDFKIGRPIVENIVSCLEESRTCIMVLTTSYAKSEWCNFEAQVAQHMFQEQNRSDHLVVVLPSTIPSAHLSRTLKYILKTRTFIEWKSESKSFWKRLRAAIKTPGPKVLHPSVSVIELPNDEEESSY